MKVMCCSATAIRADGGVHTCLGAYQRLGSITAAASVRQSRNKSLAIVSVGQSTSSKIFTLSGARHRAYAAAQTLEKGRERGAGAPY